MPLSVQAELSSLAYQLSTLDYLFYVLSALAFRRSNIGGEHPHIK